MLSKPGLLLLLPFTQSGFIFDHTAKKKKRKKMYIYSLEINKEDAERGGGSWMENYIIIFLHCCSNDLIRIQPHHILHALSHLYRAAVA